MNSWKCQNKCVEESTHMPKVHIFILPPKRIYTMYKGICRSPFWPGLANGPPFYLSLFSFPQVLVKNIHSFQREKLSVFFIECNHKNWFWRESDYDARDKEMALLLSHICLATFYEDDIVLSIFLPLNILWVDDPHVFILYNNNECF